MNRRSIIILGLVGGVIVVAIIVVLLNLASSSTTNTSTNATVQSIRYTNAITGQSAQALPAESSAAQMPGTVNAPFVSFAGLDKLSESLNNVTETAAIQTAVNNFAMAHSGLSTTYIGIKDNQVNQVDAKTLTFTLIFIRPQATYDVTVTLDTTYDVVQTVTFKQVQ